MDGNIQPVYDINRGYQGDGIWGGGGYIWIFFLFFFMIMGGGNWNNGGLNRDIQNGFDFNGLQRGIAGLERGQCDLGYATATQTAGTRELILNTGNSLSSQQADCCCSTKMEIMQNRFDTERGFCNLGHQGLINTRDINDNTNAGINQIKDILVRQENERLRDQLAQYKDSVRDITLQNNLYNRLVDRLDPYPPFPIQRMGFPYGYHNGCGCTTA